MTFNQKNRQTFQKISSSNLNIFQFHKLSRMKYKIQILIIIYRIVIKHSPIIRIQINKKVLKLTLIQTYFQRMITIIFKNKIRQIIFLNLIFKIIIKIMKTLMIEISIQIKILLMMMMMIIIILIEISMISPNKIKINRCKRQNSGFKVKKKNPSHNLTLTYNRRKII